MREVSKNKLAEYKGGFSSTPFFIFYRVVVSTFKVVTPKKDFMINIFGLLKKL